VIKVRRDVEARAIYIAFRPLPAKRKERIKTKKLAPGVHGDYFTDRLVGIEILALEGETIEVEDVTWDRAGESYAKREGRRR